MKLLILNGSPKSGRSNTMNITRAFIDGFPKGTEVEQIDLYKKEIKPCLGCFSCWSKTPGECIIKDDMQEIYEKIKASDINHRKLSTLFFWHAVSYEMSNRQMSTVYVALYGKSNR